MASTFFRFQADPNLTLQVFLTGSGGSGVPNPTGYTATEVVAGWYQITITENLVGQFLYTAFDSEDNLRANGLSDLEDDTNIWYGFDPQGAKGWPDGSEFGLIPWNPAWDAEVQSEVTNALTAYDGASFTSIPWNSAWDAEVQSEVTDALSTYDGASFASIPWNSAWDAEVQSEVIDAITVYDVATEGNVDVAKDQAAIAAANTQR